jgi:hypothetical protein
MIYLVIYIYCVVIVRDVMEYDMVFGSWLKVFMRINGKDGWTMIDEGEEG